MKYALVATTTHLLLIDLEHRNVTPLENDRPEYYGVSWFANDAKLALSHTGLDSETLVDIASYARSEIGWVSLGNYESKKCLSAPHQILCANDGRVICANTGRNAICVIDPARPNQFQEAGLSEHRWDRLSLDEAIGDHLNSVFLRGNRLYVLAHGFNRGSLLGTFSYPELDLLDIEPLGPRSGLHNIWITDQGQRISCHSNVGGLIDLDGKSPLWLSGSSMYTRGLAACADYVLIGESQKASRQQRRASLSGLWILDRHTWGPIDYLCLGPYGGVQEVRLLDVPDEAHHGDPFAGLSELLERKSCTEHLSQQRLAIARTLHYENRHWSGFEPIFGSPSPNADGSRTAASDDLCLTVKTTQGVPVKLGITFKLQAPAGQAHISLVLDYRGSGDDTNMTALLAYPLNEQLAALSLWKHNGTTWQSVKALIDNLPLEGTLGIVQIEKTMVIQLNGKEILQLSHAELGLEGNVETIGIRWVGAAVKPIEIPAK